MPLRKAARVLAGLTLLFLLYALVRQLPVLRWIVAGAKLLHGAGLPGALLTALAIYLLTLLLLPIVPLIGPPARILFSSCNFLHLSSEGKM